MPFIKGQSGNENGRPNGRPNKTTAEIRDILKSIVENEILNLSELINELEPTDRINLLVKLLPYIAPKVNPVSMREGEPFNFSL